MSPSIARRQFLAGAAASAAFCARAVAAPVSSRPQLPAINELNDFLRDQCRHFQIPGLSAAIQCGARAETFSVGHASLPFSVPVDADTLFHVGSNGKRFTAIAILQLAQSGQLKLTDRISAHVPEVPESWGDRTLEHLLHHVSGIPDYLENFDWTKPHVRKDVIQSASARSPLFAANTAWAYSNTNYMLLGYALENVTGGSYRDFVTTKLLQAAKLERSQVDDSAQVVMGRAEGYSLDGKALRRATIMDGEAAGWPDGGIILSANDFIRWERAFDQGALLNSDGVSALHAPQRLNTGREVPYGCAEFIERLGSAPYFWHTGGVPGFKSFMLRVPSNKLALMVATNVELDSSRPQRYLGQCIAEAFAPGSTPLGLKPSRDENPKLTAAASRVLFRDKAPLDPGLFAPEISGLIADPRGSAAIPGFPIANDFTFVETRRFGSATFRRYRMTYADRIEHVSIGYTSNNKIYWALWL